MKPQRFWRAVTTIAYKEFIHVWRDRRVLLSILILPPFFTLIFGHAFEETALRDVPVMVSDADGSPESRDFLDLLHAKKTFSVKPWTASAKGPINLRDAGVAAALILPPGWGHSLHEGEPKELQVVLDGTDTNTAPAVQGALQEVLADFQLKQRDLLIDRLPAEVFELGEKLPENVRHEFSGWMTPWSLHSEILYNPGLKYIDFIVPGIVGLILQLLTVTLIASTITREREVGTLAQLLVTPLRHSEIVVGKVIPYLVISLGLIAGTILLSHWHFGVNFQHPVLLSVICFLFLVCSLGLGLLISAISRTQTQAIQFSIFFLLPVLLLSGAFTPLDQLPDLVRAFSQLFPLTHFCHAFRLVNMYGTGLGPILIDLVVLALGAFLTSGAAGYLLARAED